MTKISFGTKRFVCRPLEKEDIGNLEVIVYEHDIHKFFDFGDDLSAFFKELDNYECFPVGIFHSKNDVEKLVGYINGYVYNKDEGEMLVEFFLTENYYTVEYVKEVLHYYFYNCRHLGFKVFRFEVPADDARIVSIFADIREVHGQPEEDFIDENGRYIRVFKVF